MKIAEQSTADLLLQAKHAEQDDAEKAATLYEQIIATEPANITAYERLMIVYRKQKLYKDELGVIETGIKNIKELYENRTHKPAINKTISSLSNALMKSTGLADKKGKQIYEPEPIAKWKKRKEVVEKKIKKK